MAEATTLYERVLTDYRRVLGDDHPHTLFSRHNLAHAYESSPLVGRVTQPVSVASSTPLAAAGCCGGEAHQVVGGVNEDEPVLHGVRLRL